MHVCLTSIELFGDSIFGGFGRSTRLIGRELARRGTQVSIVVPRRSPERPDRYELDGTTVYQFRPERPWEAIRVFRDLRADVYHSQDPSLTTLFAQVAAPRAAHVVTFRDPTDRSDWRLAAGYADEPWLGWTLYRRFIANPAVTAAIRRADGLYCAAEFFAGKAARIYGLRRRPTFLASPVQMPDETRKADRPTACFMGRWDGIKRVELFFELAQRCPDVEFVAVGGARDPVRDRALRRRYAGVPNLQLPGVLDQFETHEWSEVLGRTWILVNTSPREGLPTTFVEAAAYRCAILSFMDPDGFASRFGRRAEQGRLDDKLRELLEGDLWSALGESGRAYVEGIFSIEHSLDAHERAYDVALRLAQKR